MPVSDEHSDDEKPAFDGRNEPYHEAEAAGQKEYLFSLMRQLQTNKKWKKS